MRTGIDYSVFYQLLLVAAVYSIDERKKVDEIDVQASDVINKRQTYVYKRSDAVPWEEGGLTQGDTINAWQEILEITWHNKKRVRVTRRNRVRWQVALMEGKDRVRNKNILQIWINVTSDVEESTWFTVSHKSRGKISSRETSTKYTWKKETRNFW